MASHKGSRHVAALLGSDRLWIVDCGASGGVHARWHRFAECLTPILVDVDSRATVDTGRGAPVTLIVGLSSSPGVRTLYQCRKQQVSSLHVPNREWLANFPDVERYDIVRTADVTVSTLDKQLAARGIERCDFMKVDVEGHELDVLKGAAKALDSMLGLELEVGFAPRFVGQSLFREIDEFASARGFVLFDLQRVFWRRERARFGRWRQKGQLVFGNALYFRDPAAIVTMASTDPSVLARAACIYSAYRYHDLILELSELALAAFGDREDIRRIRVLADRPRPARWTRGRDRLSQWVHSLGARVANPHWQFGTDQGLGND